MKGRSQFWLWIGLAALIALGLWRLRFDVEVLNLLPTRSPAVQGLRLHLEHFANARELVVTIQAGDAAEAETAARTVALALRRVSRLVAAAHWQPTWQEHPGLSAELVGFLWLNQPPRLFSELSNRLADAAVSNALAEARAQLATSLSPDAIARRGYDPLQLGVLPGASGSGLPALGSGGEFFASPDGAFRVVYVEAAVDLAGYQACIDWLEEIQAAVKSLQDLPEFPRNIEVGYTGRPAFVAEIAGGMKSDFAGPSVLTLVVIALLFYFTHRCWRPLFWLAALLATILAATLALGGLVYGTLNVVSLGFASILLGLAEDFGIVLYQESRSHPNLAADDVRRLAMPGIVWSAITTAGAFLLLNLSTLPGLRQLGTLVALGVALAAVVILFGFLPPLLRSSPHPVAAAPPAVTTKASPPGAAGPWFSRRTGFTLLCLLLGVGLLGLIVVRPPVFDNSTESLRPKRNAAYAALDEMKRQLGRLEEPWWLLVPGRDEDEVSRKLVSLESILAGAAADGLLRDFTLPSQLWPHPGHQSANRPAVAGLIGRREAVRHAALEAGFTSNSLELTESLMATWEIAARSTNVFWPSNAASRWVLEQVIAQPGRRAGLALPLARRESTLPAFLALGVLYPATNPPPSPAALGARLAGSGALLTGWSVLGQDVFALVKRDLARVLTPMVLLLVLSLWLAFRRGREVFLSLASLTVAALLLHGVMTLLGWSWNLMNLMALPLLLGIGVDFSIHMQLALRRHQGDTRAVRLSVGRALLLAGSTTVAGFASLGFASNAGIASLGQICAAGIACSMLTAIGLLPAWWSALARRDKPRMKLH